MDTEYCQHVLLAVALIVIQCASTWRCSPVQQNVLVVGTGLMLEHHASGSRCFDPLRMLFLKNETCCF